MHFESTYLLSVRVGSSWKHFEEGKQGEGQRVQLGAPKTKHPSDTKEEVSPVMGSSNTDEVVLVEIVIMVMSVRSLSFLADDSHHQKHSLGQQT